MGEMTAGLAHELHQPLAVITNYANGCVRRLKKETFERGRLIESLKERRTALGVGYGDGRLAAVVPEAQYLLLTHLGVKESEPLFDLVGAY